MQAVRSLQQDRSARQAQELLTVEDLATLLRVPRSWVYSHSGDLGAYRLGKYLRFEWERVRERLSMLGRLPNDPL
jgi:excisionase family DNA binding protein